MQQHLQVLVSVGMCLFFRKNSPQDSDIHSSALLASGFWKQETNVLTLWGIRLICKSIVSFWKESQLPRCFTMASLSDGSQGYNILSLPLQGSVSFIMLAYTAGMFKGKRLCGLEIYIESNHLLDHGACTMFSFLSQALQLLDPVHQSWGCWKKRLRHTCMWGHLRALRSKNIFCWEPLPHLTAIPFLKGLMNEIISKSHPELLTVLLKVSLSYDKERSNRDSNINSWRWALRFVQRAHTWGGTERFACSVKHLNQQTT